jgi:magnesium transporter
MSIELLPLHLHEQFLTIIESDDLLLIKAFLNEQNITDVAHLMNEFSNYETKIVVNMSMHRAAKVFKILDLPAQKKNHTRTTPF